MDRIPKPGEFYRHFKNRMYQVLAVATHTETGEQLVIYQALYGEFGIYARPFSMFTEPVDREKYPGAGQRFRFERVTPGEGAPGKQGEDMEEAWGEPGAGEGGVRQDPGEERTEESSVMNPLFLEFLDAQTCERRLELLELMRGKVGRREVDSLCMVLDISVPEGPVEEQLAGIGECLRMQQRYDAPRLRRR